MKQIIFLMLLAAICITLSTACATPAPHVSFTNPQNGASVSSPIKVKMAAQNFRIEPAGTVTAGAGHFHIMVDTPCIPAGQVIPNDDTHRHFGKAQLETELTLTPGQHTLCLQAADGAHMALSGAGMTQQISITVQ